MSNAKLLDLRFLGEERLIGAYLVETSDGPALHDCGPVTTLDRLRAAVREHGLELSEIRHLLLSHIHFDHAGAAGALVRENPELTVWVSEIGAPHLVDPARLQTSARRIWPDADTLWGELTPIPERNIRLADGDVLGWEAFPTPGHASHHVCFFRDGTLLAGDTCGVRPLPAEYVIPVSPPPDIDVEAWHRSIDAIEQRAPDALALIHFGVATDVAEHLAHLREELDRWASFVGDGASEQDFVTYASERAGDDVELYDRVVTFAMSWQGMRRYWERKRAAA